MRNVWEKSFWYCFWRRYVDLCTRSGFASLNIEGVGNIPKDACVLLAPNHSAALMDAMMVLLLDKCPIAFGARASIFKKETTTKILRWLRILPLARQRDGLQEVAKNFSTIEEIVECLAHKVPFTIYSEGTHRAERGMMPVKKGIFRIALHASQELGEPVYVVPVGIDYEYFFHQVGDAQIRVGEPIEVSSFFAEHQDLPPAEIYSLLCDELHSRVLGLLGKFKEHRHGHKFLRLIGMLLTLPLFIICWVGSLPIWLTSELILLRMKDKAWTHTVYYCVRLFLPVFWPFFSGYAILLNFYRNFFD